eukprot:1149214-Pelagomonas_calceolata.AAC.10
MATTTMAVPFLLYQWSTHPGTSAPSLLASYLRDLSLMHATTWSANKLHTGCPGPPSIPSTLKLGMQAKQNLLGMRCEFTGEALGKLRRRWPSQPARRTPCPDTWHACQAKHFLGDLSLGGWGVQRAMLLGTSFMFGSQEEADVQPRTQRGTRLRGLLSTHMLSLSPWPGGGLANKIQLLLQMIPACRWFLGRQ